MTSVFLRFEKYFSSCVKQSVVFRGYNAYAVVALFLLYGWSMTPMMYPASFYFEVPSTAYVCLIVLNLFVGITTVVATFMISVFRDDDRLRKLNEKLQVAFLIFPNYNLGKGLMDLSYYEYMNDYYTKVYINIFMIVLLE